MQTSSPNLQMEKARWVAGLTHLSVKTIYKAAREGKIPGTVRVLGTLRFDRHAVLEWLDGSAT